MTENLQDFLLPIFVFYDIIGCILWREDEKVKNILSFRKGDLAAVSLVLLLACGLGLFLLGRGGGETALVEIRQDGTVIEAFSLTQDRTVTVEGDYTNVIRVEDGKVWMERSDCPGADCVHSGAISRAGRSIVCLPNGVEIRLVGGGHDGVDMVVGS